MSDLDLGKSTLQSARAPASFEPRRESPLPDPSLAADRASLACFFAKACESSATYIQSLPTFRAWIRSINSKSIQASTGIEPAERKVRQAKEAAMSALLEAPFLNRTLSDEAKGEILWHLAEAAGHACAAISPHGCGRSALSIASGCAAKINLDAGAWLQSAIGQGMPSTLLKSRRRADDAEPSSSEMLPSSDSKAHPQFELAILCRKFGLAPFWRDQDVLDQALSLEVEKWRRFQNRSPKTLMDEIESEKAWDQGFSLLCHELMPEQSRLDPIRHARLLEFSCQGHLTEMLDLFISRDWLPIPEWAKAAPEWLENYIALISITTSNQGAAIKSSPIDKLDSIALSVMAQRERIALCHASAPAISSKRTPSL